MHNKGENSDTSLTGDEVVISGISGHFPSSDNVNEFMENLYNKVNMVVEVSSPGNNEVPRYIGKISGADKFDAQFFMVVYKQALSFEPMCKKLIENAYAAIYDSGVNPLEMNGKKIGVFVGTAYSDSGHKTIYAVNKNPYFITGYGRTMYPNRISYWINAKGPSYSVDCACAGSSLAFHIAYNSIMSGECESALVGGCNLCLDMTLSANIKRAGFTCMDDKTKSFDKYGDGYVRSDTVGVMFLQKAKDAKRVYAELYHTKAGYVECVDDRLRVARPDDVIKFLKGFYSEIDVSPQDVEYIEADGVGIAELDKNELNIIGDVFGSQDKTVKIGSVKSNMGSSEAASGIAAMAKVCLAYRKGELSANLHYNNPPDVDALHDGRLEVVTENTKFSRGFVAINNFSLSGLATHLLLKGHYIKQNHEKYTTNVPYLVNVSGRHEEGVEMLLDLLVRTPVNPEYVGLLHNIYRIETSGHMCRGYAILGPKSSESNEVLAKSFEYYRGVKPPVFFMYSGMGSQWAGMGKAFMQIPIFSAAIERCHEVLLPKGVNLINLLISEDETTYDDILNCFIGITAVQIGLTDVLRALDIQPDYIIGHSTGEMCCAYADGCLSLEETILAAYTRGIVSKETKFIPGAMAAVGLGYYEIKNFCPPEIEVACHNSSESCTISGPAEDLRAFIKTLQGRGVFAKEVACGNIAYHSQYIASAGPVLLQLLQEIIKNPKARSPKWLSTSFMQNRWNEDIAKYSSPEYHTNNLLSPVYFEETSRMIPKDAVIIEIAPHGLLQAIIKRSHSSCVHVPLARRNHVNLLKFFLEGIGRLYQVGLNPQIHVLYPKIEYPVSTETPMLSNHVSWEHSETWPVEVNRPKKRIYSQINQYVISINDEEYACLNGYTRNGINIVPEALYLYFVWQTLAMSRKLSIGQLSVMFSDVTFEQDILFGAKRYINLNVSINKGNHRFEVTQDDSVIASGFITELNKKDTYDYIEPKTISKDDIMLNNIDIYTLLKERGYSFNKDFQVIQSVNLSIDRATVSWTNDWVTYLDALLHLNILKREHNGISKPILMEKLIIDIEKHNAVESTLHEAQIFKYCDLVRCGGVTIKHTAICDEPTVQKMPDLLLTKQFWPHILEDSILDLKTAMEIQIQIIAENTPWDNINVTEIETTKNNSDLIKDAIKIVLAKSCTFNSIHLRSGEMNDWFQKYKYSNDRTDVIIIYNLCENYEVINSVLSNLSSIQEAIRSSTFLLVLDNKQKAKRLYNDFCVVSAFGVNDGNVLMLMKISSMNEMNDFEVINSESDLPKDTEGQYAADTRKRSVILYDHKSNNISAKLKLDKIRILNKQANIIKIEDEDVPPFCVKNIFYQKQLRKNLIMNTLRQGQWGGYYGTSVHQFVNDKDFKLIMENPNDVKSIKLTQVILPKSEAIKTIKVCYAGLAQKYCQMSVLDEYDTNLGIGMDFSGIDANGEHVMGLLPGGAVSSIVTADPDLLWPVPNHWTLQEAATVPLAYVHAYYIITKLLVKSNTNVLIIGAAGAVGQALISIFLSENVTTYTTVGTSQKKKTLLRLFPQLDENNVICGSNLQKLNEIIAYKTKNELCDIVINCATGTLRQLAQECCVRSFVDINVSNIVLNTIFGMGIIKNNKSVIPINFSLLFNEKFAADKLVLRDKIQEGIAKGIVKPLSAVIYDIEEVSRAINLLSTRRHIGRVLIKVRHNDQNSVAVLPRLTFSSESNYVVVCFEDIISIQMIDLLICRGARNFVILWNGPVSGRLSYKIKYWSKFGVAIDLIPAKSITHTDCLNVIKKIKEVKSLEGIFVVCGNIANDWRNNEQEKNLDKYEQCLKSISSLDSMSRSHCKQLRHFVVINGFSQSVYDENIQTEIEKICEKRYIDNLPALSVKMNVFNKSRSSVSDEILLQNIEEVLSAIEISTKTDYYNIEAIVGRDCSNMESVLPEVIDNVATDSFGSEQNASSNSLTETNANGYIKPKGFGNFYSYIEKDVFELVNDSIVNMSTKVYKYFEDSNYVDVDTSSLIMLPGFEGHYRIFKPLCESLKIKAVTVQLDTDLCSDSIPEIASSILKTLSAKLTIGDGFYLLGYSFGVNLALEMASMLEKQGYRGIVYCLDSSPDMLRMQMKSNIGELSEINLQNTVIGHLYYLLTGSNCDEFTRKLINTDSFNKKIDLFIRTVKAFVSLSHQYMRLLVETTYKRLILGREYTPDYKLKSQLVLVKAASDINIAHDYNLSKYSELPVKVYNVSSDSASLPYDVMVPNIINELLDRKLIDKYKLTNTCDTYLISES